MPKVSYIMLWQFLEMYYAHIMLNKVIKVMGQGTLQLTRAALAGRPDVL